MFATIPKKRGNCFIRKNRLVSHYFRAVCYVFFDFPSYLLVWCSFNRKNKINAIFFILPKGACLLDFLQKYDIIVGVDLKKLVLKLILFNYYFLT
ncbi:hypothetical protein BZG01_07270 [Labilibaculum manganireducens]|uniref:Uncharacterized protein n=1 Tax=Labilibaculum manganireducens TaxID=1940525 RepID=A0A2N3IB60_9BACT|nr:hypothetical protein BZG01_07270 [Labilibaculum manganireducens]